MGHADLLAAMRRRYETATDEELLRIAGDRSNAYTDDAKSIAADLLVARGVIAAGDEGAAALQAMVPEPTHDPEADRPLGGLGKAACFLWCGIPALIVVGYMHQKGRMRASGDAFRFLVYGWLARAAVVGLFLLALYLETRFRS